MLSSLLAFALRQRVLVVVMACILTAGGIYAFRTIAIDAFPDVSGTQVKVIILDEPTTGIDIVTQHSVLDLIKRLHRDLGLTVLLVTHDINMIRSQVDRLVLLKTRLFAAGPPDAVLKTDVLQLVYGKYLIVSEQDQVIVRDYHLH